MALGSIKDFPQEKIKQPLSSFSSFQRSKIKFRLKVVDTKTWHLLGLVESLKERKYANSLLPLRTDKSISTVFKMDWGDPDHPVVCVNEQLNKNLTDIESFIAEIVFKEILHTLLFQNLVDKDDLAGHKWIQFAQKYKQSDLINLEPQDKKEWINDVVDEFSKKLHIVKKLKKSIGKE